MQVLYTRYAGLDVHSRSVSVCVSVCDSGTKKRLQVRVFPTFTRDLLEMADWLKREGVTHVAMEATGVYWRPVWAVLEDQFEQMLVNPQHMKAVPGRKTDAKDCEWIADLLQHGLLKGSFVPPAAIQDLRDLTRYRAQLRQDQGRAANRIQKLLEQANVKLSSVASNALGVSGRRILKEIIDGQADPGQLAKLTREALKNKIPALMLALEGRVREHHRFLLGKFLREWEWYEDEIADMDQRIEEQIQPLAFAVALWQTIPGVSEVTAWSLVAEIGVKIEQFSSAHHLASWAALCPGNHESAGKRKSGRMRDGNKWLRRSLCQAAWCSTRKKDCYLASQFRRLSTRRGMKRAIIAVAHSMLIIGYHMLKTKQAYQELGGNYLDRIQKESLQRYHVKKLQNLGFAVRIEPSVVAP